MLSLDLLPRLRAPVGKILGIPQKMNSVTKSGLVLPPGYLTHTRSSIVQVVHDANDQYAPGTYLLLSSAAGRRFYVGYTSSEEVEVLMFTPSAALLVLSAEEAEKEIGQHEDYRRNLDGKHEANLEAEHDPRWDEGETDGFQ